MFVGSTRLKDKLYQIQGNSTFSDTHILFNGNCIKAHRCFLSANSRFFELVFKHYDWREVPVILDFSKTFPEPLLNECFRKVVDFMYCGSVSVNNDNVLFILNIAYFLSIPDLCDLCMEYLKNNVKKEKYIKLYLDQNKLMGQMPVSEDRMNGHDSSENEVTYLLWNFVLKHFDDYILPHDEVLKLTEEEMMYILSKGILTHIPAVEVLSLATRWIASHPSEYKVSNLILELVTKNVEHLAEHRSSKNNAVLDVKALQDNLSLLSETAISKDACDNIASSIAKLKLALNLTASVTTIATNTSDIKGTLHDKMPDEFQMVCAWEKQINEKEQALLESTDKQVCCVNEDDPTRAEIHRIDCMKCNLKSCSDDEVVDVENMYDSDSDTVDLDMNDTDILGRIENDGLLFDESEIAQRFAKFIQYQKPVKFAATYNNVRKDKLNWDMPLDGMKEVKVEIDDLALDGRSAIGHAQDATGIFEDTKHDPDFGDHYQIEEQPLHKNLIDEKAASKTSRSYRCMICKLQYSRTNHLKRHMIQKHLSEDEFECDVCGIKFKAISDIISHSLVHKKNERIAEQLKNKREKKQKICYTKLKMTSNDVANVKPGKIHVCKICDKTFKKSYGLKNHMNSHFGIKQYPCFVCGMLFGRTHHVKRHMFRKHKDEHSYDCDICAMKFPSIDEIVSHSVKHVRESQAHEKELNIAVKFSNNSKSVNNSELHCEGCDRYFEMVDEYRDHVCINKDNAEDRVIAESAKNEFNSWNCDGKLSEMATEEDSISLELENGNIDSKRVVKLSKNSNGYFNCHICSADFISGSHLEEHLANHNNTTNFPCLQCPKRYREKTNLQKHMEKDHITPVMCDICGLVLKEVKYLKRHLLTHSDLKPFQCKTCGKCFRQAVSLSTHTKSHTGLRPFQCEICSSMFAIKSNLYRHLRRHRGEKRHGCSECGIRFVARCDLTRHMAVHTGEKKYACRYCGKKFSYRSKVPMHERIHTGEKPHACKICGKRFIQSGDKKRHEATHKMIGQHNQDDQKPAQNGLVLPKFTESDVKSANAIMGYISSSFEQNQRSSDTGDTAMFSGATVGNACDADTVIAHNLSSKAVASSQDRLVAMDMHFPSSYPASNFFP